MLAARVGSVHTRLRTMNVALVGGVTLVAIVSSVSPPPPPPPPKLPFVPVFISGEAGYPCIRIPSVLLVGDEALLAFAEARKWTGDGCYPHGEYPRTPNRETDIAMKRSVDGGRSWSNLTIIETNGAQPTPVLSLIHI